MSTSANFDQGQIDVDSGAAIQLTDLPKSHSGLVLKAMTTNTGLIYIGKSEATATSLLGFELESGAALPMDLLNAHKLWARASIDNQRLCWAAVKA